MLSKKKIEALWDSLSVEAHPRGTHVDIRSNYIVRFARLVESAALDNAAKVGWLIKPGGNAQVEGGTEWTPTKDLRARRDAAAKAAEEGK